MRDLLKGILVFSCLMILVVVTPYTLKYWEQFSNASTQDFANFGTNFSGILTPLFALVSAIFLGLQILETSKNNKLERLVRDHKEYLCYLSDRLESVKCTDIINADLKALNAYHNGDEVMLSLIDFYKSHNTLIEHFIIISETLAQINKIDPHQFRSSRGLTLSKVDRDILARIERLAFFLDLERGYTNVEDYKWLCKESRADVKLDF